ncbi:cytochrome P450, partial [Trifolium medium]|nr:cytochrome P450 [Trifolium medium]
QASSVSAVIHAMCSAGDREIAGRFAVLIWILWNNRNNKVWNDATESGQGLGYKAKQLWHDWFSVQTLQNGRHQNPEQLQPIQWQKPSHGWFKCNVDAGFHKELNKTSSGWCIRDHLGRFILAETTWMDGNCSILEGEAIALLEALKVMTQRGISHVIFETDSKTVVDAIHHLRGGSSEFSFIIRRINNILLCNPNFKVKFVKRQANMVAHTLARAAISWPSRCTFETLPLCITPLLNNEMI